MECDFCFEDSVFSETRERTCQRGLSYTARQCEPQARDQCGHTEEGPAKTWLFPYPDDYLLLSSQWFIADVAQDDLVEALTVLKFRADASYRREDYEKAFNEYSDCYALIPPANNAMRRDVQESQARCLIRLGRHKEALEIAELLAKGVGNTDHLTGALNLQATLHNHLGNLQEEISCLQQLISLHPLNPQFWVCLAESLMSLFLAITKEPSHNSDSFSLCTRTSLGAQRRIHDIARTKDSTASRDDNLELGPCNESDASSLTAYTNREQLWTCSCACFIRARLLLQLVQPQHASFVLERNMKTQEQIEKQLEKFGLLEEQKMLIEKVMGEDLLAERTKEEGQTDTKTTQTLTSFIMPSDAEFKVRWFQKITTFLMTNE